MSLAAKCQLLFGAAVILIITAALWVPWRRMDQLTEQINDRTARALAESTLNQHIAWQTSHTGLDPTLSQDLPTTKSLPNGRPATIARLVLIRPVQHPAEITGYEKHAIDYFNRNSEEQITARLYTYRGENVQDRYAYVMRADQSCVRCHNQIAGTSTQPFRILTSFVGPQINRIFGHPAVPPATGPAPPALPLGIVSVDMGSQLEPNQIYLNRIFLLAAGALAGTLAILVLYLITTRLILQPVHVLQETAEKVSNGDLNIRSHISSGDEFQQLSETFNVMLANLKLSQDQMRAINKSLDLKLGQLAESNVALYESNRLKSEFLANVSHELRTPLNSILGFAELLRDNGTDPRILRYVQNILASGRSLLELINDLLDLAKIEAGRMEVRSEPLSLNDLFEGLVNIIKPLTEKKEVSILPWVSGDVPIIQTDAPKLQQVLYNFLSNAIKFSPPGGRIDLRAELDPTSAVLISVVDQGPGIPAERQDEIFEKFRQIDGSVTRQHSGTGLGLAISKELIILLSGKIGVISSEGQGAIFWIVLPRKIQAGAQDVRQKMVLS